MSVKEMRPVAFKEHHCKLAQPGRKSWDSIQTESWLNGRIYGTPARCQGREGSYEEKPFLREDVDCLILSKVTVLLTLQPKAIDHRWIYLHWHQQRSCFHSDRTTSETFQGSGWPYVNPKVAGLQLYHFLTWSVEMELEMPPVTGLTQESETHLKRKGKP